MGDVHVITMISKMVIHKYRFNTKVRCVKFSPDGKHFAVCKESNVFVLMHLACKQLNIIHLLWNMHFMQLRMTQLLLIGLMIQSY